jgi:hypothetical protein
VASRCRCGHIRILRGDKPAEPSAQHVTCVNLKTTKALCIDVLTATLLRADGVIEAATRNVA